MRFRHCIVGLVLLAALLMVAGCAQRMVCNAPNVVIGNSCCLDSDSNNVCDTREPSQNVTVVKAEPEVQVEPVSDGPDEEELAAQTFADTWNRKSYNALHKLFVSDYSLKYSGQEFNFLARKMDAQLGIRSVSLKSIDGDTAEYEISLPEKTVTVSADIDEDDGKYLLEAFYFFDGLDADAACGTNSSCFMSFAVISGDRNYCDKAGEYKGDCVAKFGVSKSLSARIDVCMEILEYYSRVECLDSLAVNENDIEPCWQSTYDKQIFECMGKVAAARNNVDECPGFVKSKGYSGTRLQDAYCIMGYVKETADTKACAKIDRRSDVVLGSMQENCYKMNFP
ncbi:hypothetical protein KY363_00630 [Candidatus Woesearchaeota archaeon]|nr:hypothetical protein [Candidatus Woesearchaeota archaeon]